MDGRSHIAYNKIYLGDMHKVVRPLGGQPKANENEQGGGYTQLRTFAF